MERILLLMTAAGWPDAAEAVRSARENAAAPERLTFGLSLREEPDEEGLTAMQAAGGVQFLCPGTDAWSEVEMLWRGEGFILMGHPAMRFTRHWDMHLLHALRRCRREGWNACVLTGYLPRPADPIDAVYPVAAEGFDAEGRLCFHRGTALRYAVSPLRSAFIHPDFCFASAGFFREMAREGEAHPASPLFLRAHRCKWEAYTLHRPLMQMKWDFPLPTVRVDTDEENQQGSLTRFEKRFSLRFREQKLSAMARQGVFTADLSFPVQPSAAVRLQEAAREVRSRRSRVNPLCVTAFLSHPQPEDSLKEEYMSWFARLARLKNLALLAYADGPSVRQLTAIHPNVLEYKRRYGLPVEEDVPASQALDYVRLCKPFLLAQSREKMLGHSHYIWLDFGYLRYPVYEGASLIWNEVCTDKITMASVEGRPDPSMIVMPQQHVLPLSREITALCQTFRGKNDRLPQEEKLWQELIQAHPDMFRLIELPGRRELLTMVLTSREEEFHAHI